MRQNDQPAANPLTPVRAVLLGLVQGPTELLPVSSSAHLGLLPKLAGWGWDRVDPGLRKDLEVALHAGATLALAFDGLGALAEEVGDGSAPALLPAVAIPAVVGLLAERAVEEVSGRETVVAVGLAVGAAAMLAVDGGGARRHGRLNFGDGVLLGVAQALALIPGVSRSGATLVAARGRGFGRRRSERISAAVGLPVLIGAAGLKAVRVVERRHGNEENRALLVGAAAAAGSTLLAKSLSRGGSGRRRLWPIALYRLALATVILVRRDGVERQPADRAPVAGIGSSPDER